MSLFSRLFGSKDEAPQQPAGGAAQRFERLEQDAQNAAPGYVGTSYNRAGDVALKEGDTDRALSFYGRAIDTFLSDEQPEAARGVANKIIRVRPHAVRTLCTLTWLDLAAGHGATALLHLRDYVEAAKEAKRQSHAASQIFEMARIVPDPEVLGAIADALDSLDYGPKAAQVREWESKGGSPDVQKDTEALALACRKGAARSSDRSESPTKSQG